LGLTIQAPRVTYRVTVRIIGLCGYSHGISIIGFIFVGN